MIWGYPYFWKHPYDGSNWFVVQGSGYVWAHQKNYHRFQSIVKSSRYKTVKFSRFTKWTTLSAPKVWQKKVAPNAEKWTHMLNGQPKTLQSQGAIVASEITDEFLSDNQGARRSVPLGAPGHIHWQRIGFISLWKKSSDKRTWIFWSVEFLWASRGVVFNHPAIGLTSALANKYYSPPSAWHCSKVCFPGKDLESSTRNKIISIYI